MQQLQPKEYGIVYFDTQPHGAKIYVDGQLLTDPDTEESLKTPERVLLVEGRRDFTFVLEGHKDLSGYIDVIAGTTVNIFRNMEPGTSEEGWKEPEPQTFLYQQFLYQQLQETGMVRIYSFPDGADAYINGRYVGKAPIVVTDVPAGVAIVGFEMPGMMLESKLVDIHPGAWSDAYATMRPVLPELSQQSLINYNINEQTAKAVRGETIYMNTMQYRAPTPGSVGSVTVMSYPEGATVCLDGSTLTYETGAPVITPVTLILLEGYHDIALELGGYYTGYERVYVYPGAELTTATRLTKKMFMSTIQSMQEGNVLGDVVISTYPIGAKIYMDGNLVVDTETMEAITTPAIIAMYMGYHDLRFVLEGFYDEFWGVYVEPRSTQYVYRSFSIARSC